MAAENATLRKLVNVQDPSLREIQATRSVLAKRHLRNSLYSESWNDIMIVLYRSHLHTTAKGTKTHYKQRGQDGVRLLIASPSTRPRWLNRHLYFAFAVSS